MRRHLPSALLLTLGLLLATAVPALAHARLEQKQVPASSSQELTLVVPGEREGSLTTSVELLLPAELTDVACGEITGWACEADDDGEAGSTVLRFTREPEGDPEAELPFTATTPDEPTVLRLPTIQVYDDGTEVAWIQTEDGAERPAPALEIVAADASVVAETEAPDSDHGDPAAPATETESSSGDATVTDEAEPTEEAIADEPTVETTEDATAESSSSSPVLAIILAVVALGGVIAVFVRRAMAS